MSKLSLTRRAAVLGGMTALATPSILRAQDADAETGVRRNASSFKNAALE